MGWLLDDDFSFPRNSSCRETDTQSQSQTERQQSDDGLNFPLLLAGLLVGTADFRVQAVLNRIFFLIKITLPLFYTNSIS